MVAGMSYVSEKLPFGLVWHIVTVKVKVSERVGLEVVLGLGLFLCFYFILFYFPGRLLVLYFSLVAPVICYLFFLHVVLYVFLANK